MHRSDSKITHMTNSQINTVISDNIITIILVFMNLGGSNSVDGVDTFQKSTSIYADINLL